MHKGSQHNLLSLYFGCQGGAVIAVETFYMETLSHAPYSGVGNIGAHSGGYFLCETRKA